MSLWCQQQGHCGACRRKWRLTDTDLCPCGETQTMSHTVESCPLTKLNGGLYRLHSADEDAVSWLTNYGKWHAYEKKKKIASEFEHAAVTVTVRAVLLAGNSMHEVRWQRMHGHQFATRTTAATHLNQNLLWLPFGQENNLQTVVA